MATRSSKKFGYIVLSSVLEIKEIIMAGKYLGVDPIKTKDGRTLKQGDIYEDMPYDEAVARVGFEPVTKTKEIKKPKKESYNE